MCFGCSGGDTTGAECAQEDEEKLEEAGSKEAQNHRHPTEQTIQEAKVLC